MSYLEKSKGPLLFVSRFVVAPAIVALTIAVLWLQMTELDGNKEVLPLSSFVLLISLSALGFNWCRTNAKYSSEAALDCACRSAISLFVAGLLALISAGLTFIQQNAGGLPDAMQTAILALHWLFLALALMLSLVAILSMLFHARLN